MATPSAKTMRNPLLTLNHVAFFLQLTRQRAQNLYVSRALPLARDSEGSEFRIGLERLVDALAFRAILDEQALAFYDAWQRSERCHRCGEVLSVPRVVGRDSSPSAFSGLCACGSRNARGGR